jgi:putative membrane protein
MTMSEEKKLHPVIILTQFIKQLKSLALPLVFAFFVGGGNDHEGIWVFVPIIIFGLSILIGLINGAFMWLSFRYWLEDNELRVKYGFLWKKKRYIPFERIQTLQTTEGVIQRIFGLVKVSVETAGSNSGRKAEVELSAISKKDADWLKKSIADSKNKKKDSENETKVDQVESSLEKERGSAKWDKCYQMSFQDLLIMGTTSGGLGVIFSAVAALVAQFNQFIPYDQVWNDVQLFVQNGVVIVSILIFLIIFLTWLVAVINTFLRYAFYQVERNGDDLRITRGLFEKRQIMISINKIQGINLVENILRQPLGYAVVQLDVASGSLMEKGSTRILIFPLIKKRLVESALSEILPHYQLGVPINRAPQRSRLKYIFVQSLVTIPVIAGLSIFIWPYGLFSIPILGITAFFGQLKYRSAGWNLFNDQLTLQYRIVSKITVVLKKSRIQSLTYRESFRQKKKELATVETINKSGNLFATHSVKHLEKDDVQAIYKWFRPTSLEYKKKRKGVR